MTHKQDISKQESKSILCASKEYSYARGGHEYALPNRTRHKQPVLLEVVRLLYEPLRVHHLIVNAKYKFLEVVERKRIDTQRHLISHCTLRLVRRAGEGGVTLVHCKRRGIRTNSHICLTRLGWHRWWAHHTRSRWMVCRVRARDSSLDKLDRFGRNSKGNWRSGSLADRYGGGVHNDRLGEQRGTGSQRSKRLLRLWFDSGSDCWLNRTWNIVAIRGWSRIEIFTCWDVWMWCKFISLSLGPISTKCSFSRSIQ